MDSMFYDQTPNQYTNHTQSIRNDLDRETRALYQERNAIQVHRPSNTQVPTYAPTYTDNSYIYKTSERKNQHRQQPRKTEIKNRIKQLIDLCKDENSAIGKDFTGILEAEKGVLELLKQTGADKFDGPGQHNAAPTSTHYTPIKGPGTEEYREQTHPGKNLQKEIRSTIKNNSHIHLSEDALRLIDEIQRKSLVQIQKLRQEKLALTNSLNEQIRNSNALKRRNNELQKELNYKVNGGQGTAAPAGDAELRNRIAYLEGLLQQQQKEGQGFSLNELNVLYAQGEAIRQETIRLLKLKQSKLTDDSQKRQLKEENYQLQQKIESLENERDRRSKPSYEIISGEYSPIAPNHKRTNSYRNSANEYESLVMEMRKITNN